MTVGEWLTFMRNGFVKPKQEDVKEESKEKTEKSSNMIGCTLGIDAKDDEGRPIVIESGGICCMISVKCTYIEKDEDDGPEIFSLDPINAIRVINISLHDKSSDVVPFLRDGTFGANYIQAERTLYMLYSIRPEKRDVTKEELDKVCYIIQRALDNQCIQGNSYTRWVVTGFIPIKPTGINKEGDK